MKKFGLIVIGGGSGLKVSSKAAEHGLKVAVIEKGPLGGTCLNRGCIPSKILLHTADIAETINGSGKFGINSKITKIRFSEIIKRASNIVDKEAKEIEQAIISDKNTTLYKTGAKFIGNKLVKVGNETITAKKIVIAAGTRPFAPPIPGLKEAGYITSDEALRLKKQPKTMTIIGGGYIGCELAHFFGSLGTKVTILEFIDGLLANEDFEISKKFTEIFSKKHSVCTGYKASKVEKSNVKYVVYAERDGKIKKIVSDELLVAVGRIPNTDTLNATASGIKTSKRGYIEVNDFMETNVKGIWALGDIAGKWFFKHSANLEAECVYNNIFSKKKRVNYEAMPHAIFTSPQIAGVGMRGLVKIACEI